MEYISVKEAAERWHVSQRRVLQYCQEDRIIGLIRMGRSWGIPENAEKPVDPRVQLTKEQQEIRTEREQRMAFPDRPSLSEGAPVTGAVITAAGYYNHLRGISPYLTVGSTTLIRQMVRNFYEAGVSQILVVAGYKEAELRQHLSDLPVRVIRSRAYRTEDKFSSAKMGLKELGDTCDKVFVATLRIPMFMPETLLRMIHADSAVTIPMYRNKGGYPMLLDRSVIPFFVNYEGTNGLQGAVHKCSAVKKYLQVDDDGLLLGPGNIGILEEEFNIGETGLKTRLSLSVDAEKTVYDTRIKLLLGLIRDVGSLAGACRQMALSQESAVQMIRALEQSVGYPVICEKSEKKKGSSGTQYMLTEQGGAFLDSMTEYEEKIRAFAQKIRKKYLKV